MNETDEKFDQPANLIKARLTVQGTRPLLWHAFNPKVLAPGRKVRGASAGNDPSEWRLRTLVTARGRLFLRPMYVFGCLRDGAKYTPKGKSSLQGDLAATLQVQGDEVVVDRWWPGWDGTTEPVFNIETVDPPGLEPDAPVYLDIRGVRNPSTRAFNVRYRVAAAAGWTTSFEMVWDRTIIGDSQMRAIARDAGTYVGIGDGRRIGLGRFEVRAFDLLAV